MNNIDVELEELLGSSDNTTEVASDQNSEKEVSPSPVEAEAEPKISDREAKRARELADRVKELEAQLAEKNAISSVRDEDFITNIQDEPTRDLVSKILEQSEKKAMEKVAPLYADYQKAQFEKTFTEYAQAIPGLDKYRDILYKDFERNPDMDFKGKIGSIIVELQMNKRKPIESQGTIAPREKEEVDISKLPKDEMYAYLKTITKK